MLDIIKLALVLLIISAVAGLAIAFTNKQTAEKIEQQKMRVEQQALKVIFAEGVSVTKRKGISSLTDSYWIGKKDDKIIGYAFKGSSRGYSSDIKFIVGVDSDGTVLGLTILSQSETPGLGTRIQEIVSKNYLWNGLLKKKEPDTPWFTKQFIGINVKKNIVIDKSTEWHKLSEKNKKQLKKKNKVTALTGATISTKAVCTGIKKYAYKYLSVIKNKKEIHNNDSTNN